MSSPKLCHLACHRAVGRPPVIHKGDPVSDFNPAPPPKNNWILIAIVCGIGVVAAWAFMQVLG